MTWVTRIVVEVDDDTEPVSGTVRTEDGGDRRFEGYVGLIGALHLVRHGEEPVAHERIAETEPSASRCCTASWTGGPRWSSPWSRRWPSPTRRRRWPRTPRRAHAAVAVLTSVWAASFAAAAVLSAVLIAGAPGKRSLFVVVQVAAFVVPIRFTQHYVATRHPDGRAVPEGGAPRPEVP